MDVADILNKAWEAVKKSSVPESLHEVAFREAVDMLRSDDGDGASTGGGAGNARDGRTRSGGRSRSRAKKTAASRATAPTQDVPDEDTFFSQLADESGVAETDLRDILQLTRDGKVQVTHATRALGSNTAEQARTVVVLVAGARAFGLGERPIDGAAVRQEVQRKRCFDSANYAASTLGRLRGFNPGSNRNEIVTTSRWDDDFKAAVDQAHGRGDSSDS